MARILVTGGAGFIGHHLVRTLVVRGDSVVVLDNLHRGSFDGLDRLGLTAIHGDVRDRNACEAAMKGCDVVVHLAAQSNVMGSESSPDYTFHTNVDGTWNVARAAAAAGVRRLIFTSSREVYGEPTRLPVAEDQPLRPKNTYGASKAAGEMILVGGAAGDSSVLVLRLANVIGPGDTGRVLPTWLAAIRNGERLRVFGGRQVLDFVPVDVCVAALVAAVDAPKPSGPINVGSGSGTSLLTVAERLQSLYRGTSCLDVQPARSAEVVRFVADVTRMRRFLGVEPPEDPLSIIPAPGDPAWA
jgi:UDP-glucose 4-epimerase